MAELRVRFASPDDQALCARYDSHLPPHLFGPKIAAQELLLAEIGAAAVGYLRLEYLWGKVPYIGLIYVDAAQRGRGTGRAILGFLEAHLRARGYRMLLSSSQVDEAAPQAWHRGVGFRECGILAGINEGGVGEVFFRKEL